jgi:hypothetical protein
MGGRLNTGDYLTDGYHWLVMQSDCNLVLYDKRGAPWYSNTAGLGPGCYLTLQPDGNLVIYQPNGHAVWASATHAGDELIMQRDGNVVLYDTNNWSAQWATNTVHHAVCVEPGTSTSGYRVCLKWAWDDGAPSN